jgi:hypothetical protein
MQRTRRRTASRTVHSDTRSADSATADGDAEAEAYADRHAGSDGYAAAHGYGGSDRRAHTNRWAGYGALEPEG